MLDPFAGTGTTLVVAKQLFRNSIGVEIDPTNVSIIKKRIGSIRTSDGINKYISNYEFTEDLELIWPQNLGNFEEKLDNQITFLEI